MWILRKPIVIILLLVLAGAAGAWFLYFKGEKKPHYEFATVERKTIVQEVSVTGKVKPAKSVELAFEKTGRVIEVLRGIGDKVYSGEALVRIDSSELAAKLLEAEAGIKAQQAKLDEMLRGTRPEEIQVEEARVENAKTALADSKRNLLDKIRDSFTRADDAIRNKTDQFFTNPRGADPQLNFSIADSKLESGIELERRALEQVFSSWSAQLASLAISSDLNPDAAEAGVISRRVALFLDSLALALSSLTPGASISQTTIDSYRADVSTARTNINTALSNLSAALEKLRLAESSLAVEERELALKKAGASAEEIRAQQAEVEKAEANAQNIRAQIEKTVLRAPLNGVVTREDAKVGEIVSANAVLVSLISEAQFEIEANVPEADVAKLKIGNPARVTLDAYGNDIVFEAEVALIDPAETVIDGVPTYKTTLQFLRKDERVKSGMTANLEILTDSRENVIAIPQRAVISEKEEKFVWMLISKDKVKKVWVKTGLRGSDGNIEITDGLKEGDKVITFVSGDIEDLLNGGVSELHGTLQNTAKEAGLDHK